MEKISVVYESYTCAMNNGTIEYGFTFKESHNTDDAEFDMVIGVVGKMEPDLNVVGVIKSNLLKYEWAAKAVVAASANR